MRHFAVVSDQGSDDGWTIFEFRGGTNKRGPIPHLISNEIVPKEGTSDLIMSVMYVLYEVVPLLGR